MPERQLGAFLTAFLLDTREAPTLLHPKQIEFRNAVAHKGRFPTREEIMRYCQAVLDAAIPVLSILRSEPYADTVRSMTFDRIRERSDQARKDAEDPTMRVSTMSISTALSFAAADQPTATSEVVPVFWTGG